MFPLMKKHLYLGQDVDGYAVVSFNSNYTGGSMKTPLIVNGENYADTLTLISSFNSGGSVNIYGGGTATTSFTDWRLPSKTELENIKNLFDNTPGSIIPIGQTIWTSTNGVLDPSTNKYAMESTAGGYLFFEYNKVASIFDMMLIRNFTL